VQRSHIINIIGVVPKNHQEVFDALRFGGESGYLGKGNGPALIDRCLIVRGDRVFKNALENEAVEIEEIVTVIASPVANLDPDLVEPLIEVDLRCQDPAVRGGIDRTDPDVFPVELTRVSVVDLEHHGRSVRRENRFPRAGNRSTVPESVRSGGWGVHGVLSVERSLPEARLLVELKGAVVSCPEEKHRLGGKVGRNGVFRFDDDGRILRPGGRDGESNTDKDGDDNDFSGVSAKTVHVFGYSLS
jgi:hypothetical protein